MRRRRALACAYIAGSFANRFLEPRYTHTDPSACSAACGSLSHVLTARQEVVDKHCEKREGGEREGQNA